MKIELYAYDSNIYDDLDDAQEDGAIYLLSDDAATFNLSTLETIKAIVDNTTQSFADKKIELFVKTGGVDHSFESIRHDLENKVLLELSDIALHSRCQFETDFNRVRASITWLADNESSKMVTISNSLNYRDLEVCDFCGKCDNCIVDESYFYYADSLSELDQYLDSRHPDGWKINYYSVED